MVPVNNRLPTILEPEYTAFTPDGKKVFVSIQEANIMVEIDTHKLRILRYIDLGTTTHKADIIVDGKYSPGKEMISFLREPDGITISPDGKYIITADEGDTIMKASKVKKGNPVGGGRSVSIFDVITGKVLGDTGGQLDNMVAATGKYPDSRSEDMGSEPETVVAFTINNILYGAVSLERADAIGLISFEDITKPIVLATPIFKDKKIKKFKPEGLCYYKSKKENAVYLYTGDEKSGTSTVFKVSPCNCK